MVLLHLPLLIDHQQHVNICLELKIKPRKSSSTKPIFDKATEKWTKAPSDDGKYPYDAVGALLRHGPGPFVTRIVDPKGYEQSVLSYMANTGCTRAEATGNMDAKLNNAADWAFQKLEEKKTGKKVDYTVLDPKQAALTIVWALGITPLVCIFRRTNCIPIRYRSIRHQVLELITTTRTRNEKSRKATGRTLIRTKHKKYIGDEGLEDY